MPTGYSLGEYLSRLYRERRRELSCEATDPAQLARWQEAFGSKLRELMSPFPEPAPLEAQVLERIPEDGYIREAIVFRSEPDVLVPASLLVPSQPSHAERWPAILALHGHGNGKDDVCGVTYGEARRVEHIRRHNYDYAAQFARQGYVVLAPDARGFGERRVGHEFVGADGCNVVYLKAQLLGLNPLSLNVWDAMRVIDLLQSRPEVNPDRIGAVGLSFGGTWTMFTAALDGRLKAAVISGYLNTFEAFALGLGNFCGSQVVPGLLRYGEQSDVAALIAPRPVLYENGVADEGFPVEAARAAFTRLEAAYAAAGYPDRVAFDLHDGGHQFRGRRAFAWMKRWLNSA